MTSRGERRGAWGRTRRSTPLIGAMKAADLALRAQAPASVSDLTRLERSSLFAEVSMVAYLDNAESFEALDQLGFDQSAMIENDGAQAYVLQSESDCVVVCRGTERTEWNDVRASFDFFKVPAVPRGRVHRGFDREVEDLWPTIEPELSTSDKSIWFTGHSLGGAMAMICALRCLVEHPELRIEELYTFGSPRVGTAGYVRRPDLTHIRWVNNNDIVARVPPPFLRYRHAGELMYLNRNGQLAILSARQRAEDRWQGLRAAWGRNVISDHAIAAYVRLIGEARAGSSS